MNTISRIKKAINDNLFTIEIWNDIICFNIYEVEISIIVEKDGSVYIDAETYSHRIYPDMLKELLEVIEIIKENIEEVKNWVWGGNKNEV